jgi:putative membrane protein
LAQAGQSPTPTSTTTSTPVPTPTATPAVSPTPTRPRPALNLPSGKDSVDRQRAMDTTFMSRALLRGLELVELGRVAADRASNQSVRALGQQIVQDRGKANEELRLFAQGQAIALPPALDADRRAGVDRISRLSPPALERALVQAILRLHDADVAEFQKQTQMAQEVELQGWVYDTLPVLEDLQGEIHRIAGELGISVRSGP